ncbi:MAG: MoaD/ThiS family protein [Synergistaceae bacterium]|nr:MoaD/ThiS family protein [Synergistaceae bacterium]
MTARIHLLGLFKRYRPSDTWQVPSGDLSIGELLAGIEEEAHAGYIAIVNGERKTKTYVPADGDDIKIMPLVTGG